MTTIFRKEYDGESLYDLPRDIAEAFEENFNEAIKTIPKDDYGIQKGTFTVTVTWTADE